ncbi:hypothetical protein K562_22775 [Burkholderia cenocepacia]|nr:hypothetical protein K562_22775 [Burkholderia cenocepacia]
MGPAEHRVRQRIRLRYPCNAARSRRIRRRAEMRMPRRRQHAEAAGPDDTEHERLRRLQRAIDRGAIGIGARLADDHRDPRAQLTELAHDAGPGRGWRADHGNRRRRGQPVDIRDDRMPVQLAIFRIDRPDRPLERAVEHTRPHHRADTARARRRADDRNGLGLEQRIEMANGHIGSLRWRKTTRSACGHAGRAPIDANPKHRRSACDCLYAERPTIRRTSTLASWICNTCGPASQRRSHDAGNAARCCSRALKGEVLQEPW